MHKSKITVVSYCRIGNPEQLLEDSSKKIILTKAKENEKDWIASIRKNWYIMILKNKKELSNSRKTNIDSSENIKILSVTILSQKVGKDNKNEKSSSLWSI